MVFICGKDYIENYLLFIISTVKCRFLLAAEAYYTKQPKPLFATANEGFLLL